MVAWCAFGAALVLADPFSTWKEMYGFTTFENETDARANFELNFERLQQGAPTATTRSVDATVRNGRLLYRLNRFAVVHPMDFVQRYRIDEDLMPEVSGTGDPVDVPLVDEVDWNHVVTVYDQEPCESSWLHVVVNLLEAHETITFRRRRKISAEYLTDCLKLDCDRGNLKLALERAFSNGYCYADEYERRGCGCARHVRIQAFDIVASDSLERVLNMGPVVAVVGLGDEFQFYSAGVLHDTCTDIDARNHALLLTGYGVDDDGVQFWRGVGSFGPDWGEAGFFRIERNATKCGINQEAFMISI